MEALLSARPTAGDVIPGLRGARKVRFGFGGRGKRGGGRAIYFLVLSEGLAVMLVAYGTSEREDLSPRDRRDILDLMEDIGP